MRPYRSEKAVEFFAAHIAEAQMHNPRRRHTHEDTIRKIRILGDDHEAPLLRKRPQLAVRRIRTQIQCVIYRK